MSEPNNQIAAELDDALIELSRRKRPVLSQRARKAARIALIKSVIEKATEAADKHAKFCSKVANERLEEIAKLKSRAAHASETIDQIAAEARQRFIQERDCALTPNDERIFDECIKAAIEKAIKEHDKEQHYYAALGEQESRSAHASEHPDIAKLAAATWHKITEAGVSSDPETYIDIIKSAIEKATEQKKHEIEILRRHVEDLTIQSRTAHASDNDSTYHLYPT